MDGDCYRDMSHADIQQLIWRRVAAFADYANVEQRLSNGKIADVFYQMGRTTVIVEVKTVLKTNLIEAAYRKYASMCDYLAIASPPQLVHDDRPPLLGSWADRRVQRVGIWWVDWLGLTEVRPAFRLDTKTPGYLVMMSRAVSPFTAIASPGCTASEA